jgi:hypothetical protein
MKSSKKVIDPTSDAIEQIARLLIQQAEEVLSTHANIE